jgi:two-component system sensor histidine kinase KdpD
VRARAVGERLRVRIVDQGPGIGAEERERVFEPFYRGADGGRLHHGSGLGLAIARGFVEVNGGRIGVESAPGQGTSFVVEFPLAGAPQDDDAPDADAASGEHSARHEEGGVLDGAAPGSFATGPRRR